MNAQVGKRERLIASAVELSRTEGFSNASLSVIADHAGLAAGDTYYYFKTRSGLAEAVVETRSGEYEVLRQHWEAEPTPIQRLQAFVNHTASTATDLAAFGCPVGGICMDLGRVDPDVARLAGQILLDTISWAQHQFDLAGEPNAEVAGNSLVARLQGAAVIAHATQDPDVITKHCRAIVNELTQP